MNIKGYWDDIFLFILGMQEEEYSKKDLIIQYYGDI